MAKYFLGIIKYKSLKNLPDHFKSTVSVHGWNKLNINEILDNIKSGFNWN